MSGSLALLCRAAIADLCANDDHRWPLRICLSGLKGCADGVKIIAILYPEYAEAVCLHALCHILRKSDICVSLDGDLIGIVDHDQFPKPKSTCQRECFRGKSLHHTSVPAQYIGIVVNNPAVLLVKYSSQMGLCHGHTHCHAHALTKRPCSGLYPYGMTVLRVARCQGTGLAEVFDIFNGEVSVSKEMEQRV